MGFKVLGPNGFLVIIYLTHWNTGCQHHSHSTTSQICHGDLVKPESMQSSNNNTITQGNLQGNQYFDKLFNIFPLICSTKRIYFHYKQSLVLWNQNSPLKYTGKIALTSQISLNDTHFPSSLIKPLTSPVV